LTAVTTFLVTLYLIVGKLFSKLQCNYQNGKEVKKLAVSGNFC